MIVEQLYTGCLAEAAYYIQSKNEAVIIDPMRETKPYLDLLKKNDATLKYVFLTHFHADFVSGFLDLAKLTGATVVYGPTASTSYDAHIAKDNETFLIGDVTLKVLHTPGHTLESSTYLLFDEKERENAIFSGDTLFLGDVGRPDLAIKSDLTREQLAGMLFDSLRNKIMTLPKDIIVYPGHGAGSACGKNMSKETVGSLKHELETNYALRSNMTKQEFIDELLEGILPPPQYFSKNALLNKNGYKNIEEILSEGNTPLDIKRFKEYLNDKDILVLDVRTPQEYANGHIQNSLYVGINGGFAPWVGALVSDLHQRILIIAPEGKEEETVLRLSRVGYDHTLGYLKGGFETWIKSGEKITLTNSISADEFAKKFQENDAINILDVRKNGEYKAAHLPSAIHQPLDFINDWKSSFNNDLTYVHCAGGYRSMIACSILEQEGYTNTIDIQGGFGAIKKNNTFTIEETICPSTLK
jgi:hydroxyacylglutathione hydrolase